MNLQKRIATITILIVLTASFSIFFLDNQSLSVTDDCFTPLQYPVEKGSETTVQPETIDELESIVGSEIPQDVKQYFEEREDGVYINECETDYES